jgi:nitric oxide reductase NorQ protein
MVHTGKLIISGVGPFVTCKSAIIETLTDNADMLLAVNELGASLF